MLQEADTNNSLNFLYSKSAWEQDARFRFNLDEFNQEFHESVPVLKFIKWYISHIESGSCETILPINVSSTNQYITHQAALILLAADYTGGIALASLLQKTHIMGFHPMTTDFGAYVWGAKANIKWFSPSTDDLICKAEIPEKQQVRHDYSRKLKWDPSDFSSEKVRDDLCLRRPRFVLRTCHYATSS